MREIKFRAWDRKRKKMWYPNNDEVDFYAIGMSGALYALDENGKYDYTEEFEKMIFMQFTGLFCIFIHNFAERVKRNGDFRGVFGEF